MEAVAHSSRLALTLDQQNIDRLTNRNIKTSNLMFKFKEKSLCQNAMTQYK